MPNPGSKRREHPVTEALIRLGMMAAEGAKAILKALWFLLRGLFRALVYMFRQAGRFFRFLGKSAHRSLTARRQAAMHEIHQARRTGKAPASSAFRTYVLGEHGILRTCFNYLLPTAAIFFLVTIMQYGSGLDYAISVAVSGEELGIISAESDFLKAEEEVQKRIAMTGEELQLNFNPVYTLRIVSDSDDYLSTNAIADKLLISSHHEIVDAYGVYVGEDFIGAVASKDELADYLNLKLADYAAQLGQQADSVFYAKDITYQSGVYLKETLVEQQDILNILESTQTETEHYTVLSTDTLESIAAKFNTTVEELQKNNTFLKDGIGAGMSLSIRSERNYVPIAYTKTLEVTSPIEYSSVRVETSSLNLGVEQVIAEGVRGERSTQLLVTYIDGVEESREVLSTVVTREPIPEQIGVGTSVAHPDSTSTVLEGNGMFGWPVNGGRISDHFGGERNHKGLDIAAPTGTEVYAAAAGTVVRAGWNSGGYGNYVILEHPDGYRTLYAHGSEVIAVEGQQVEKGQLILLVGSTGDSTGPHCHFEVRVNNICVNPEDYVRVNAD